MSIVVVCQHVKTVDTRYIYPSLLCIFFRKYLDDRGYRGNITLYQQKTSARDKVKTPSAIYEIHSYASYTGCSYTGVSYTGQNGRYTYLRDMPSVIMSGFGKNR